MTDDNALPMSKRDLLALIGRTGSASAMYMTMASLGLNNGTRGQARVKNFFIGTPPGQRIALPLPRLAP